MSISTSRRSPLCNGSFVYSVIAWLPELSDKKDLELFANSLSEQQRAKFDSLRTNFRRRQFVYSRWLVKKILKTLGYDQLLQVEENGKLYVQDETIDISISHSYKMVAIVVGRNVRVGIDIEYQKQRRFKALYQHTFNKEEKKRLDSISTQALAADFYRLWTAKEATAKLTQTTLITSLEQFLLEGYFDNHSEAVIRKNNIKIISVDEQNYFLSLAYRSDQIETDNINIYKLLEGQHIKMIPSNPLSVYTCA